VCALKMSRNLRLVVAPSCLLLQVDRCILDEAPCILLLLTLRGMVPLMTKVAGCISERKRDRDYAANAVANRTRFFSQDDFPDSTASDSENRVSTEAQKQPYSTPRVGFLSNLKISFPVFGGSASSTVAIPTPVTAPTQSSRLKAGLLLPSPHMRSRKEPTQPPSFELLEELRDYNSDPEMPTSKALP
jgi:hypothetical protein